MPRPIKQLSIDEFHEHVRRLWKESGCPNFHACFPEDIYVQVSRAESQKLDSFLLFYYIPSRHDDPHVLPHGATKAAELGLPYRHAHLAYVDVLRNPRSQKYQVHARI